MNINSDIKKIKNFLPHNALSVIDIGDWTKATLLFTKNSLSTKQHNIFLENIPDELFKHPKSQKFQHLGDFVLMIYFKQWFMGQTISLNLALDCFDEDESFYYWKPSRMKHHFKIEFKDSVLNVYKGHFHNNDDLFSKGLEQLGLTPTRFSIQEKLEVKQLFKNHFGDKKESMSFKKKEFLKSFESIFNFLLDKNVKLSSDFLFLGFYLATLYNTLEKLDEKHNIKDIYTYTEKGII